MSHPPGINSRKSLHMDGCYGFLTINCCSKRKRNRLLIHYCQPVSQRQELIKTWPQLSTGQVLHISSIHFQSHTLWDRKGRDVSYDAPVVKAHQFPQLTRRLWEWTHILSSKGRDSSESRMWYWRLQSFGVDLEWSTWIPKDSVPAPFPKRKRDSLKKTAWIMKD